MPRRRRKKQPASEEERTTQSRLDEKLRTFLGGGSPEDQVPDRELERLRRIRQAVLQPPPPDDQELLE